jgi:hypothetical protein
MRHVQSNELCTLRLPFIQYHDDANSNVHSHQDPEENSNRPFLTVEPLATSLDMNPEKAMGRKEGIWTPHLEQLRYFNNAYRKRKHQVAHD